MKYFICSDIHGSASNCKKILDAFERENADFIIFLGDILYHGPRNDLPDEYAPKKVIELLKPYSKKIIACRGNCDGEVEEMVLDFPLLSSYNLIVDSGIKIFATHGHVYSPLSENSESEPVVKGSKLPPMETGIVLYGHTHVSKLYKKGSLIIMNPGSPSIPKESSCPGYGIIEISADFTNSAEKTTILKTKLLTLDGEIISQL